MSVCVRFGLGFKGGNSLSVEQSQFNGQETGATALAAATDYYTHHGQNEAAIIVGVFSNEVDSTGSVHSDGRALVAESPAKLFHRLLAQPLVLSSLRCRLWDRHNSPSPSFWKQSVFAPVKNSTGSSKNLHVYVGVAGELGTVPRRGVVADVIKASLYYTHTQMIS